MSKSGIVNMSMVITEEKILSSIDKVQKLINPKSKKQIIELEEDSYFRELIESIKTYLMEYPKKNNFPVDIYRAAYGLVEIATTQFEENTKKIEGLIKQREENIVLSGLLKGVLEMTQKRENGWEDKLNEISDKLDDEIVEALRVIGNPSEAISDEELVTKEYKNATKKVQAKINNLESNLHIEIDMDRLEDNSKALSYIGIEIADALKLIPVPEAQFEAIEVEKAKEVKKTTNPREEVKKTEVTIAKGFEEPLSLEQLVSETLDEIKEENNKAVRTKNVKVSQIAEDITTEEEIAKQVPETIISNEAEEMDEIIEEEKQQYVEETTFEAKPSLWQKFKNSKFVRAATYIFRIKVRIELPSNALPEGRGNNG